MRRAQMDAAVCSALSAVIAFSFSLPLYAQNVQMQLIEAAMRGDAPALTSLLAAGANPNEPGPGERTALVYAAAQGNVAAVQALLGAGAAANARDHEGASPLMMAAGEGHGPVVDLLIAKGADVNAS